MAIPGPVKKKAAPKTKGAKGALKKGALKKGAPKVPAGTRMTRTTPTAPITTTPISPKRAFTIKKWDGTCGEKIMLYADSGMGKTTLASMLPDPVFIALDDGSRKIKNPKTGEALTMIDGIETFDDIRSALSQVGMFDDYKTIVVDTVTVMEELAVDYTVGHIPTDKGARVNNIEGYGYGKGYRHLYDTMKLILQDCDALVRKGKNVAFLAQSAPNKTSNAAGEDYLREGPRLYSGKYSVEALYCEWVDHVLRIGYPDIEVVEKKVVGDNTRAVFVQPEPYFRAKSRTIKEPVVSFENEADDSIWIFVFGGATSE